MNIYVTCDLVKDYKHLAEKGIDVTARTKSGHKIALTIREHGLRLWVDEKEQQNLDFQNRGKA